MLIDFDTVIYASLILYILYAIMTYLRRKRNHEKVSKLHLFLIFIAWMYFTCLINFTLFPVQLPPIAVKTSVSELVQFNPIPSFFPIKQINLYHLVGNICLFIPFIPLMSILRKTKITIKYATVFSLLLSLSIEFLQFLEDIIGLCSYFFRQVDITDVLMNVFGGVIGCIIINIFLYTQSKKQP
jgi:glycopeptide antibiotics resistance protein